MLRLNRPEWDVCRQDVRDFSGIPYKGKVDLLAGGVPCPPFSVAGKQLGKDDERDLFPQIIRLCEEISPKAIMIENVRGLLDPKFDEYRLSITSAVESLGYSVHIKLLNASDYGVPQLRPRVVIVGIRNDIEDTFSFPMPRVGKPVTVGDALYDLMSANGWKNVDEWRSTANSIAPTLVGGSKKHGGPDLGPTRARAAWLKLGVDGKSIAYEAPSQDFEGCPKLTPRMLARIQGFPDSWIIPDRKTLACRMIGNAFPPPVAKAVAQQIKKCLDGLAD